MTTINRPKLDRPCPSWCTSPNGHGWDGADYSVLHRGHSGPVSGGVDVEGSRWDLALGATEHADAEIDWDEDDDWTLVGAPGPSLIEPTYIDIEVNCLRLNSSQARELAGALTQMADQMDAETGR